MSDEIQHETRRFLRSRSLAAGVLSLSLGASVGVGCSRTEPSTDSAQGKLASAPEAESAPKKKKKEKKAEPAVELPPVPGTLRLEAHRTPDGATIAGWEPVDEEQRPVVRFSQPKATVQFDLTPVPGNYVLTAVARVQGTHAVKLSPTLNGKALPPWSLTETWAMYSSKVPKGVLAASKDELALAASALEPSAEVEIDSVALTPVSDRARVEMGAAVSGLLIDGFYEVEGGKLRWSRGSTSVVGVVLEPAKGAYKLDVRGASFKALGSVNAHAIVNGKDLGSGTFEKKFTDVIWEIPAGALTSGLNRIELVYSETGKPSDFSNKSKDEREIAVNIARIEVEPAGS